MKSTSGSATPTSPASSASAAGGKMVAVRVQMLDDSITLFQVQVSEPPFDRFALSVLPSLRHGRWRENIYYYLFDLQLTS